MFRTILCPSSGAREYYTDGRCLWYLVLWFSSCRYDVELKVMCPVCRLLLYCSDLGRVGGGWLKVSWKREFGSFWLCSWISLPVCWRDCMWNCSRGNNMLSILVAWSKVIVLAIVPYSCWLCKICWAYADFGLLVFIYLICSWNRVLRFRLVCPTYERLHVLHVRQ